MNNYLASLITFTLALAFLRLMDFCAHKGWIESRLSRKLIHIGTGPLYVLCWLLFNDAPQARWLAALVPLAITLQFVLIGLGLIRDEASVRAMSRSGDPREILRGPLFYGIVFVLLTLVYWKDSPIGITALMLMCGGDGIADLAGRRIASPKLPHSPDKSIAGSLGVFCGGWLLSAFILWIYSAARVLPGPFTGSLLPVTVIALIGTLVESLPFRDVDNLTVPLAAVIAGHFLF